MEYPHSRDCVGSIKFQTHTKKGKTKQNKTKQTNIQKKNNNNKTKQTNKHQKSNTGIKFQTYSNYDEHHDKILHKDAEKV